MIKVIGVIGNEKGQYSLVRLIQDVKKEPENEPIHILISSPGGDGELAFDMHDFLRGQGRQITTECTGECASAASILFLSGDKRIAGCPLMIHNPWMEVTGDSDTLACASKWIGDFEKRCEKFYAEKTGLDENTISNLMSKETYIAPSEAVSLNFATEARQIAMALIHFNSNNNQIQKKMAEKGKGKKPNKLAAAFAAFMEAFEDDTVNMMDLTTASGDTLVIDREEGEPQVGDAASPDGSHVMPDGTAIVVTDGVITEIVAPDGGNDEELEQLRAENTQLREQLQSAQSNAKTTEENAQLNAIKMAGGNDWLAKQCSHYKPAGRVQKQVTQPEGRTAKRLAELRAKKQGKA